MDVHVSARTITVPRRCVCCCGAPDTDIEVAASRTSGKRVVRTTTRSWSFPYCNTCLAHAAVWDARNRGFWLIIVTWLLVLMLALAGAESTIVLIVAALGTGAGLLFGLLYSSRKGSEARQACTPTCQGPGRGVAYNGWSGSVHSFYLASKTYALLFMRSNQNKLVNLEEEAWRLLNDSTISTGTEAAILLATPIVDPRTNAPNRPPAADIRPLVDTRAEDEIVLKWVSKLESLKGPSSRRTALDLALREVTSEEARQRLLLTASRIEVQAILDKVDQLKTTSARKRHLTAAIDAIKTDPVPDELQKAEIAHLESALRELDDLKVEGNS